MNAFLLLALIVTTSADTLLFKPQHDAEWSAYKIAFRKTYTSNFHEAIRRVEWEKNLQYIQKHNLEADLGQHTYRLGLNEFTDLSNEEYKQMLLCKPRNVTNDDGSTFLRPNNIDLPETVDWRKKGYVTPVKNQKACGSCWAFSTTGSLEGQHYRKTGKLVSLSEQNLVDCSTKFGNNGCGGGHPINAFRYIIANGGIDTEASYRYEARDNVCRYKSADVGATAQSYMTVKKGSETMLQEAVASVGPISASIDASHKDFRHYKSGVYNNPNCSPMMVNHAVLVVGYGSLNGVDYWLVKNSWGTPWGQNGYILMSRNKSNQCGIASSASFPVV